MENNQLDTIAVSYEGRSRDALLPFLWDVQTAFGHISPEAVHVISHTLLVPEADIYGVISFYELFHEKPTGETIIRICTDPSCWLRDADDRLAELCATLGLSGPGTTADGRYTVESSSCVGLCEHAPAALISQRGNNEAAYAPIVRTDDLLRGAAQPPPAVVGGNPLVLLQGIRGGDPESLQQYGQYRALHRAVTEMTPEDVIEQVKEARLLGRGGAAFPTGVKWAGVRANLNRDPTSVHYVICNGDESEPGTFKDRVLMEERPHLLLEGMALCAYAVGAQQGYIFVRGEYPTALARLQHAITEAQAAGLLGSNILGTMFSFHVEIRRGAGAYISRMRVAANGRSSMTIHSMCATTVSASCAGAVYRFVPMMRSTRSR
jgi:NADH-quinone oxidoreductase subunit F